MALVSGFRIAGWASLPSSPTAASCNPSKIGFGTALARAGAARRSSGTAGPLQPPTPPFLRRVPWFERIEKMTPSYHAQRPVNGLYAEVTGRIIAELGIVPTVCHSDYIGAWLAMLKDDARAIFCAASQASKAADYLLAFRAGEGEGKGAGQ